MVDDVADVRRDLRLLLEIAGDLEVAGEAADGWAAVRQAVALRPDVVVMDLAMPRLDGHQAARLIKSELPGCRLVALTVHCDGASRKKAEAAGFDAFVVKGTPVSELLGAIGSLPKQKPQADRRQT
ncbi:MAG: hypothetical protein A2133_00395 [Actinobacteria bacterium RBG_16_64_13]|nr:MAG: hypothetical protein A2133_00395 [Actinobacteria bacterium RBG_16_64_13]